MKEGNVKIFNIPNAPRAQIIESEKEKINSNEEFKKPTRHNNYENDEYMIIISQNN